MYCTWIKTIITLRKFGHLSYSIKQYHDKVLRLKGGKSNNYTEKEAKSCLSKEMKTAVTDSKGFMRPVEKIARSKYKYETGNAGSMELWLKAGVALGFSGKDSPKYAVAMKSYVESLRIIGVRLGYDIDEIEAFNLLG